MQRIWLAYIRKSVVRDDTDLESPERQLSNIRKALEITENKPYEIKVRSLDSRQASVGVVLVWFVPALLFKVILDRPLFENATSFSKHHAAKQRKVIGSLIFFDLGKPRLC